MPSRSIRRALQTPHRFCPALLCLQPALARFQVPVTVASLLYIEVGTNFALDMLSIGVEVPEGVTR